MQLAINGRRNDRLPSTINNESTREINNVNRVMRLYCKLIIESKGEVNVGRRQMKRDGLRKLEMQYSVRPITRGIVK